jgi:hypothetical protein
MKKILLISLFLVNIASVQASEGSYSPSLMRLSQQVLSNLSRTGNSIFRGASDHLNNPINLFMYSIVGTLLALKFVKPVSNYRELQNEIDASYNNQAGARQLGLKNTLRLANSDSSEQQVIVRGNQNNRLVSYEPGQLPHYSEANALTASIIEIFGDIFGLDRSLRYKFLPYTKDQEDAFNELDVKICVRERLTDEENQWYWYLKPLMALGGKEGACIAMSGNNMVVLGNTGMPGVHTRYYTVVNSPAIENGSASRTNLNNKHLDRILN